VVASTQLALPLPELAPAAAAGLLAAALAAWTVLHVVSRRLRARPLLAAMFLLRVAAGFAALLLAADLASRAVLLATDWPVWPIALGGAAGVEAVASLYALERRTAGRAAGATLAALRGGAVLLVVAMLAQPVFSRQKVEEIPRDVAVLLDESASMRVADAQRGWGGKLRIAEALGTPGARRRGELDVMALRLREARDRLVTVGDDLAALAGQDAETRGRLLAGRRAALEHSLTATGKLIGQQAEVLGSVLAEETDLPADLRQLLREARGELLAGGRDRLAELAGLLAGPDPVGRHETLLQGVRKAAASLTALLPRLAAMGDRLDDAACAALPEEVRSGIDAAASRTRLDIARELLLRAPVAGNRGLLATLREGYKVRLCSFASDCREADASAWTSTSTTTAPAPGGPPGSSTSSPTAPPDAAIQRTDLAAALTRVMTDMSGKQLAGVVMLGDGRHNGTYRVEPIAEQLGLQKVPFCSIVMAPARPPRDAAVVAVNAPETVAGGDEIHVEAELKLDGLAGQSVRVALYDGAARVDPNDAPKVIAVPADADSFRARATFRDAPKAGGLHAYSVRIEPLEGEAFAANNSFPLTVNVSDQRTRLLLIDGRPRWEFRYVKNLFADRDRGVRLQYVLLHPDRIADANAGPPVHASASRPPGDVEATALPATPEDWLKFDVVILGDVARADLSDEQLRTIGRFVTDAGGTLVVVAGPDAMPHAYADTPLAEVLPVTFAPTTQPVDGSLRRGFHIALTPAGRASPIMYQDADAARNLEVWASLPEITWRHPTCRARANATVLACTLGADAPRFLRETLNGPGAERPTEPRRVAADVSTDIPVSAADAARQEQARRYEMDHPLIVVHQAAAGRVATLTFDRTWRLRYGTGDSLHHKFWGQVLRWATADRLPGGTEFVKLGADRTRYAPGQTVRLRAKIVRRDLSPVVSERAFAIVSRDGQPLTRQQLLYVPGTSGMYAAELAGLPSGAYRAVLEAPEIGPILAPDKVAAVAAEFSVDPVVGPERTELSADVALLGRLAAASGGVVLQPHQAAQVLSALGPRSIVRREVSETRLWDSWLMLGGILALAAGEWILRKRRGLP